MFSFHATQHLFVTNDLKTPKLFLKNVFHEHTLNVLPIFSGGGGGITSIDIRTYRAKQGREKRLICLKKTRLRDRAHVSASQKYFALSVTTLGSAIARAGHLGLPLTLRVKLTPVQKMTHPRDRMVAQLIDTRRSSHMMCTSQIGQRHDIDIILGVNQHRLE